MTLLVVSLPFSRFFFFFFTSFLSLGGEDSVIVDTYPRPSAARGVCDGHVEMTRLGFPLKPGGGEERRQSTTPKPTDFGATRASDGTTMLS